jgi:hypothetical protein
LEFSLAVVPSSSAAPETGKSVFMPAIMTRVANVAATVPGLISVEVIKPLFSASRQRASVAVMRVIAIIDVAVEAARPVKPWAGS